MHQRVILLLVCMKAKQKDNTVNNYVVNLSEYVANIKWGLTTAILCLRCAWRDDDEDLCMIIVWEIISNKLRDKSYALMELNFKRGDNPKIHIYLS